MSSDFAPDLPPHLLAKRKRQQEEDGRDDVATASGAKRAASPDEPEKRRKIGPALPVPQDSPPAGETRSRKVAGPAPPPAPLDERPPEPLVPQADDDDSSDDDDGFGPALPSAATATSTFAKNKDDDDDQNEEPEVKVKRDEWMMMPPKQDDLAARLDPLKARPTKFAGKGASKGDTDNSTWHETPEQKQKRLQDEMMGISSKPAGGIARVEPGKSAKAKKDEVAHRLVNEQRGPSLMEQHAKTKGPEAVDDDPSKRAFDREKDMGTGGRISSSQKKQMLDKAAGFAGKFAGGSYL